jgi:hypothetical protein
MGCVENTGTNTKGKNNDPNSIKAIRIDESNLQEIYTLDEKIQNDLSLIVEYNDNSFKTVTVTPDMISGFDSSTNGTIHIQISYNGKFTFFTVQIGTLISNMYFQYQTVTADLDNLSDIYNICYVDYYNGGFDFFPVTADMLEIPSEVGQHNITYTYKGYSASFDLNIGGYFSYGDFEYYYDPDSNYHLIINYIGNSTNIIIPSAINGVPVKHFQVNDLFKNHISNIEHLTIPLMGLAFTDLYNYSNSDLTGHKPHLIVTVTDSLDDYWIDFVNDSFIKELIITAEITPVDWISNQNSQISSIIIENNFTNASAFSYLINENTKYLKLPSNFDLNYFDSLTSYMQNLFIDISEMSVIANKEIFESAKGVIIPDNLYNAYIIAWENDSQYTELLIKASEFSMSDDSPVNDYT